MKTALFILLLIGTLRGAAQADVDNARLRAFVADTSGQPALAARWYLEAAALATDTVLIASYQTSAGRCLIWAAAPAEKEEAYRKAIYLGKWNFARQKTYWAARLADMYLATSRYDSAFAVLDYGLHLPQIRRGCSMGSFNFNSGYHHKLMLALEGMGKPDSAIAVFLPFAFDFQEAAQAPSFTFCHTGDDDYHCMVVDFVRLLRKRYSAAELELAAEAMLRESKTTIVASRFTAAYFESTLQVRFLGCTLTPFGSSSFISESEARERMRSDTDLLRNTMLYHLLAGLSSELY
ncbi:hypothetical protein [Flaviaesturariibacter amylovorans]|uniref:hypothetical protein n=1 Tax=Flaviaesturariibacter amylovorans TaxID=1084520 RepID=UPI0031EA5B4B